jgi:hypothetical protein
MAQTINFELDTKTAISAKQLYALGVLAMKFCQHDIRVIDDPTNIKVYVGPYYAERYRFWVKDDGLLVHALIEKDHGIDTEESDWQPVDWYEASDDLLASASAKL